MRMYVHNSAKWKCFDDFWLSLALCLGTVYLNSPTHMFSQLKHKSFLCSREHFHTDEQTRTTTHLCNTAQSKNNKCAYVKKKVSHWVCCVWLSHSLHIYRGCKRRRGINLRSNFNRVCVCVCSHSKLVKHLFATLTTQGWSDAVIYPSHCDDHYNSLRFFFSKWPYHYIFIHFKLTYCYL